RVSSKDIDPNWQTAPRNCNVPGIVSNAIDQNQIESIADQLAPRIPEYRALKDALKHYRDVAAHGGWQPLQPEPAKPNTGKTRTKTKSSVVRGYTKVPADNLRMTGDLQSSPGEPETADAAVFEAVRRFQARHGLDPDGVLDVKTVSAMNIPVEDRIEQIE